MYGVVKIEFQFKHCTIISECGFVEYSELSGFQFKHCTIIRKQSRYSEKHDRISIQALYDYKFPELVFIPLNKIISIQALYDYKEHRHANSG